MNLTGSLILPAFTKLYATTSNNSYNMLLSRILTTVSPSLVVRACTRVAQPSTSRLLARSSQAAPRALFSTSPRRLAKEAPEPPSTNEEAVDAFKQSSVYQKLASNPKAIQALQNFGETMKKHGIDISSGKPPSMLQMSKLFMNSEFRDASKQLLETLKEAGVDLTGKDVMQEMQEVMKKMK